MQLGRSDSGWTRSYKANMLWGSNGLGGDVYILRSAEDPARVAHLAALEGNNDVSINLSLPTLDEFNIGSEAASLLEAANVAMRRPF